MTIITRDQWGSKSKWKYGNMILPAINVYLHHSVTPTTDFPYQDAKRVEAEGIAKFGQLSYSYLFHKNGTILEGAGTKTGAHTAGRNSTSFGLCLIGDYDDAPGADVALTPTPAQIEAVQWLIYHLKTERNWLNDNAILTPHRAAPGAATACPGNLTMPLLEEFRKPWVPPAPQPGVIVGETYEVDMRVTNLMIQIQVGPNGKGWLKIPYAFDRVLSVIPHTTRPAADGYDIAPDKVGATPEDTGTIVVIQDGNPNSTSVVWVRVTG